MNKRANGEATIGKRKDRRTWRARWTEGFDADGKQIRRSVSAATRREVIDKMNAIRATSHEDFDTTTVLSKYMIDWLEAETLRVAVTTQIGYARIVRLYIDPYLGHLPLGEIRPRMIEEWLSTLLNRPLSPATVKHSLAVLRKALKFAVRDGLIGRNPASAEFVDGVRQDHKEGRTMTKDEAKQFLQHLDEKYPASWVDAHGNTRVVEYHPYALLARVLLHTGLRKGEALALQWGDFDGWVDRDTANVKLLVSRSLKEDERGATYTSQPKTSRSRRTVMLTPDIAGLLEHLMRGPNDIVFQSEAGTHLDPRKATREIKRLSEEAGIGVWTAHELRHTAASLMLSAGVPLKSVSEQLGHSSIRVTADVYGHLVTEDRERTAITLAEMLN